MEIVSTSPQRPDDVVVRAPDHDAAAVAAVARRVRAAAARWAADPASRRAEVLHAAADAVNRAADDLTALVVREVGKPTAEASAEVARGVAILRYFAQQALDPHGEVYPAAPGDPALVYTRRHPRGVAGLITPWNFPVAIPLWKAAPALAFGNGVLLKPAEESSAVALRLAELLATALPPDVFSVVTGGALAGAAVVDQVDCVSFTGSVGAGHAVREAAAHAGIPAQCEMGGQNASIVLPDADAARAAAIIAGAAMGYSGQKCTATSRVIAVGGPARVTEVSDALVAAVEALSTGDPAEPGVTVGPVITAGARDAVLTAAARATETGGRILTGGAALDRDGWYVTPTVVGGLRADAELAQQEVFGPICAVLSATDPEHGLDLANGVPYGLTASVFTRDLDHALDYAARLRVGLARVNAPTSGVDFWAPFGGSKDSSYGPREQGKAAREFYTETRTVTVCPAGGPAR